MAALFGVGAAAGVVLYHAAFGFTSAWRIFIADGRGAGLRAQMLMLAVTCAAFFPLLAAGEAFGTRLNGAVQPVGVPVLVGAFIFGIGMQLGGGCASGTLFTVGGGNTRMVVTLLFFIVGSLIGTAHSAFWGSLPTFPATSLVRLYGPVARAGDEPGRVRRDRRADGGGRTAQVRAAGRARADAAPATVAARAVAAGRRGGGPGRGEPGDAAPRRTAVGRHLGLRAVGRQGGVRRRRAGGNVAVLVVARAARRAGRQRVRRRHQRDGLRHRPRRPAGGPAGRPVRAGVVDSRTFAGGRRDRRPAARLRRARRLRLQHRRLLQRHRLGQPARLAVAAVGVRRQHRWAPGCGRRSAWASSGATCRSAERCVLAPRSPPGGAEAPPTAEQPPHVRRAASR